MESPKLLPEQIKIVEQHVRNAQLSFSHLEDDLIDHMCCYTEELMESGYEFDTAIAIVRKEVGLNTLKNIEIETILLLNQKLNTMKTLLKVSGITGIGLALASAVFKINHWPGANWLMLFGSLFILFAYLPVLIITLRKEKILGRNISLFYSGAISSVLFIALWLFTFNHWPYSNTLRMLFWLSSIIFILLLFLHSIKREENRIINLSAVLMLSFMLISSITLYSIIKSDGKRLHLYSMKGVEDGTNYLKDQNKHLATLILQNDSTLINIVELRQKTTSFFEDLNHLKSAMYRSVEEKELDNYRVFYLGHNNTPLEYLEKDFEKSFSIYRAYLVSLAKKENDEELVAYIEESLAFHKVVFNNHKVIAHNTLCLIEREVYNCQNQILLKEFMN